MLYVNAVAYAQAQTLLGLGTWRVDPFQGHVYGARGNPLRAVNHCGYLRGSLPGTQQNVLLHRVVWESVHGPIPNGLTVNHMNGCKTDNRIENLELLSPEDNSRHGRQFWAGVASGEGHGSARLTNDQVRTIYRRAWQGEMQTVLAAEYGCHKTTIHDIQHRRRRREQTADLVAAPTPAVGP